MHHKIAIIDDDEHAQETLDTHLSEAGFTVVTLSDASTALARVRAEMPALIILDLMIANMAGLEICKALKSEAATVNIPIIMLTAKKDEVDVIVGLELARTITSSSRSARGNCFCGFTARCAWGTTPRRTTRRSWWGIWRWTRSGMR